MPQAMTYEQHQERIARWMEGQDDLTWRGYKVTPKFDMVIDGRRVRPKLQTMRVGNCKYTRVKHYKGIPKMHRGPLCGCC